MKIHQILPCLRHGDAIGNHTIEIQRILQRWGYESLIFAEDIHADMRSFAKSYKALQGRTLQDAILIYHFSVGSAVSEFVKSLPNTKRMLFFSTFISRKRIPSTDGEWRVMIGRESSFNNRNRSRKGLESLNSAALA